MADSNEKGLRRGKTRCGCHRTLDPAMNDAELLLTTVLLAVAVSLVLGGVLAFYVRRLRIFNIVKRQAVLDALNAPPGSPRSFVGFFHPYWSVSALGTHPVRPLTEQSLRHRTVMREAAANWSCGPLSSIFRPRSTTY